ncbi:hypothetical protein E1263_31850 [Kribbella antibiotica]|uniref:Uncharacterized protein n=1 Tax=Kribbella antibiotica TaxID=190195 RepID=A0A4R4YZ37_9ACTN|nr:hypothetical protein [Kribbella antibiotica]TDD49749.1 hypothetical protein E1263_31850 [Kribbella antibiotica]
MTAQNHHVQNDECRDLADQAPTETDPLGPITLPTRLRIGARALALSGVVGLAAAAAAVVGTDPNTITITTTTC